MQKKLFNDAEDVREHIENFFCQFYELYLKKGFNKNIEINDFTELPGLSRDVYEAARREIIPRVEAGEDSAAMLTDRGAALKLTIYVKKISERWKIEFALNINHPPTRTMEKKLERVLTKIKATLQAKNFNIV